MENILLWHFYSPQVTIILIDPGPAFGLGRWLPKLWGASPRGAWECIRKVNYHYKS